MTLADALWPARDDRPRARQLVEDAQAQYQHAGHKPGTERAARWLGAHPAP